MKTTDGRKLGGRKSNRRQLVPPVAFNVFIGYHDVAAMRQATYTITDAVRSRPRRYQIHPKVWRFAQLASAHWRERAIKAALEADVVVLASSSAGPFDPEIECWINDFLKATRGRRTTIVAVMGHQDAWTISIEADPEPVNSVGASASTYVDTPLLTPADPVAAR